MADLIKFKVRAQWSGPDGATGLADDTVETESAVEALDNAVPCQWRDGQYTHATITIEAGMSDRSGLTAEDAQDEILVAACMALDKAHDLLSFVVRYDGALTPQFVEMCKAWVDGEYDPGTHRAKSCAHNWAKAVLDGSIWCTRCGVKASTETQ